MSNEFPKSMVHPAHQKGTTRRVDPSDPRSAYQGTPDRYPPVTVGNQEQEDQHRAMGYVARGEPTVTNTAYHRYPMMLTHPDHEPAVEAIQDFRDPAGRLLQKGSPGREAKLSPVTVANEDEEAEWIEKGYQIPGKPDPDAAHAATAMPYVPGRTSQEYPKMVNGQLVQDPGLPSDVTEYPKWITIKDHPHGGLVVSSKEAEEDLLGPKPQPDKAELAKAKRDAALKAKAAAEVALALAEADLEGAEDAESPALTVNPIPATTALAPQDAAAPDRDALKAQAAALGIEVAKTWNARTIAAKIAAHTQAA